MKRWNFTKKNQTICLMGKRYGYVIQLSLRAPWWIPHKEIHHYKSGILYLYGWVFFYIGFVRKVDL